MTSYYFGIQDTYRGVKTVFVQRKITRQDVSNENRFLTLRLSKVVGISTTFIYVEELIVEK